MTHSPAPFTFTLPDAWWTPEQDWIVHAFLADLLEQIEAHYGAAVQQWLSGEDPDAEAYRELQRDLFAADFDDPLLFGVIPSPAGPHPPDAARAPPRPPPPRHRSAPDSGRPSPHARPPASAASPGGVDP
jgi:hypothetical protein